MSPVKVLVADDDPEILAFHRLALGDLFELVTARDGIEAWNLFQESRPRIVVTDLNMPGMNGLQLTDKIRGHEELATTPVIILTGTTINTDLPPGFWNIGTQANSFMEKPVTMERLITEIRRQLMIRTKVKPLPPGKGSY